MVAPHVMPTILAPLRVAANGEPKNTNRSAIVLRSAPRRRKWFMESLIKMSGE